MDTYDESSCLNTKCKYVSVFALLSDEQISLGFFHTQLLL